MSSRSRPTTATDIAVGWRLVDWAVAARGRLWFERLGRAAPYLMLLPAFAFVSVLAVGLFNLFWLSIHSYDPFLRKQGGIALEQYRRLFTGEAASFHRQVLLTTISMSFFVTVAAVALALPVSYFIVRLRHRWWRFGALCLILVPFLMGEVVRAFGWLLLLGQRGALNWLLRMAGLDTVELVGTAVGIWIGMMQVMIPIAALVMLPVVRQIGPDLEAAAQTLGARPRRIWSRIIIPLARSGMMAASLVVFTLCMTEFAVPQVLGFGRYPFVANAIQSMYFLQNNIYLGSAFAMVLVLIVTAAVVLLVRLGRGRPQDMPLESGWGHG